VELRRLLDRGDAAWLGRLLPPDGVERASGGMATGARKGRRDGSGGRFWLIKANKIRISTARDTRSEPPTMDTSTTRRSRIGAEYSAAPSGKIQPPYSYEESDGRASCQAIHEIARGFSTEEILYSIPRRPSGGRKRARGGMSATGGCRLPRGQRGRVRGNRCEFTGSSRAVRDPAIAGLFRRTAMASTR